MFLVNSRLGHFTAAPSRSRREAVHDNGAPLLPKLRGNFAEFLNEGFLDRLSILYSPTCVGLGYGRQQYSLEVFLGSMGLITSSHSTRIRFSGYMPGGFAYPTPYKLNRGQPTPRRSTLLRHSIGQMHVSGTGISTSCPSPTPLGLGLGPD